MPLLNYHNNWKNILFNDYGLVSIQKGYKLNKTIKPGKYIDYMKENDILTVFHYIPLHSAPAGREYGVFAGEDKYTTKESERIVRLPLYYNMGETVDEVISKVYKYFE